MFWNLGKYGIVDLPGPYTDYPGGVVDMDYLDRIIEGAKKTRTVPWCASEWHEMAALEILKRWW